MSTAGTSAAANIKIQWDHAKESRQGRLAFSEAIGQMAPYSGTVFPEVVELRKGYSKIQIGDRREVRNHLNSIHAIAQANVAEMASGLAMLYSIPDNARAIITGLSIDYLKKARGVISAECECQVPETNERREYQFDIQLRDATQDLVAKATVRWLVGPDEPKD